MDVVVSNFHEGWERKGGVEEGEKWWRSRTAAAGRPVDRRPATKIKGKKGKEGREERKRGSDGR